MTLPAHVRPGGRALPSCPHCGSPVHVAECTAPYCWARLGRRLGESGGRHAHVECRCCRRRSLAAVVEEVR